MAVLKFSQKKGDLNIVSSPTLVSVQASGQQPAPPVAIGFPRSPSASAQSESSGLTSFRRSRSTEHSPSKTLRFSLIQLDEVASCCGGRRASGGGSDRGPRRGGGGRYAGVPDVILVAFTAGKMRCPWRSTTCAMAYGAAAANPSLKGDAHLYITR